MFACSSCVHLGAVCRGGLACKCSVHKTRVCGRCWLGLLFGPPTSSQGVLRRVPVLVRSDQSAALGERGASEEEVRARLPQVAEAA